MENIYSQEPLERNSATRIPEGFARDAGVTLRKWLGTLWRGLNQGEDLVRGLQEVRGHRLAQLYLDILEAASLKDRNGMPVFHRDLWHPIVLRKSQRDTAQENMLVMGEGDAVMGPQPESSVYGQGTVLRMGRLGQFADYVTYPADSKIVEITSSIVDNIVNPSVSMTAGVDFVFRNGSVIFPRSNDPLGTDSKFEKYDVPTDDPSNPDVETVLWASDVLIDRNYVADHLSYALGANAPSSAEVKRILNAAWSSVTSGLTPELVRTLLAAMLNVPVIQDESETVTDVTFSDGDRVVITNARRYKVSPKARLRKVVYPGAVLKRGELLDESVRIYPFLNGMSEEKAGLITGFSVPLSRDIPSVQIPREILRMRTEYGVYAMWGEAEVKRAGTDANGNPKLYFDLGGTPSDVEAFWNDVWKRFEASGTSMSTVIKGSSVSPARFFLDALVGANTLFVVVDRDQVDDISMMRDPMFFGMLCNVVPSAIRLFLVEHRTLEGDEADLGEAAEAETVAAHVETPDESVPARPLPGLEGRGPSCGDRVSMRFVRPAPAKVRGKKEEE